MAKTILQFCLCLMALSSFGRIAHSGNLTVELYGVDGKPITDATITVMANKDVLFGRGCDSEYNFTSANSNDKGVASVDFKLYDNYFEWELKTPSHYSRWFDPPREFFKCDVVESDYMNIDTNTVDGLAKYNELKKLYDAGNAESFMEYVKKFEPKSVTFKENTIHHTLRFYPKKNPQPMHSFGEDDRRRLDNTRKETLTNGYVLVSYPTAGVNLKDNKITVVENADSWPKDIDFKIVRNLVVTNGVRHFYGKMVFAPGCGAYKAKKTTDESFPSTYSADVNAEYLPEFEFESVVDANSLDLLSQVELLCDDEYMVLRTRKITDESGDVTGWNYSKILGSIYIDRNLSFTQSVFNPRFNDPNLEFDFEHNLSHPRYDIYRP